MLLPIFCTETSLLDFCFSTSFSMETAKILVVKEVEARIYASASTAIMLEIYEIRLNMEPSSTSQLSRRGEASMAETQKVSSKINGNPI